MGKEVGKESTDEQYTTRLVDLKQTRTYKEVDYNSYEVSVKSGLRD